MTTLPFWFPERILSISEDSSSRLTIWVSWSRLSNFQSLENSSQIFFLSDNSASAESIPTNWLARRIKGKIEVSKFGLSTKPQHVAIPPYFNEHRIELRVSPPATSIAASHKPFPMGLLTDFRNWFLSITCWAPRFLRNWWEFFFPGDCSYICAKLWKERYGN